MEKTKAQIAADTVYPIAEGASVRVANQAFQQGYELGYNAATLKWSDKDMIEFAKYACCLDTNDPVPVIFKEWLKPYKDAK